MTCDMPSPEQASAARPVMPDREPRIVTQYDPKPIPVRLFDLVATFDGYEPGDPIGLGSTEQDAINDLRKQVYD